MRAGIGKEQKKEKNGRKNDGLTPGHLSTSWSCASDDKKVLLGRTQVKDDEESISA